MRRKRATCKRSFFHKIKSHRGFVTILLILVVVAMAALLSGALFGPKTTPGTGGSLGSSYLCCDSGDGDACTTSTTEKFTWKGDEYALLKSDIVLVESGQHLAPASSPDDKDPKGNRIFINTTNTDPNHPECKPNGEDAVFKGGQCIGIPNDIVIYVCKSNCEGSFGTGKFDAYLRLRDGIIPDPIKNCSKPEIKTGAGGSQEIVIASSTAQQNLQLYTFKVIDKDIPAGWLSPYCKPAVYLYPETTSFVNVQVSSPQALTYTYPLYPQGGWSVLADPTGVINYQSKPYDYLYYETKVADQNLVKPDEGFVVEKNELKGLFTEILPKLGLNVKEAQQFSDYWLKVLPRSPYYFIGIIPQTTLNSLTSLTVNPRPATEIRVTLYFELLEQKISVDEPQIYTPIRTGFTVVEWGGVFKKNKNTDFSCFQ